MSATNDIREFSDGLVTLDEWTKRGWKMQQMQIKVGVEAK